MFQHCVDKCSIPYVTIRHSLMEADIMKTNEHKPLILCAFQLR